MPAEEPRRYQGKLLGNTPVTGGWRLLRLQQAQLQNTLRFGQRLTLLTEATPIEAYLYHIAADWFALLAPPSAATQALPLAASTIDIIGPHGGWPQPRTDAPAVVLASGAGMAAALAFCEQLQPTPRLVLLDSAGLPLPFRPRPSLFVIGGLPPAVIATAPLLENLGVPCRLIDPAGQPGCFEGTLRELFTLWLASHPSSKLEVFSCLPAPTTAELRQYPALRLHDANG